MRRRDILFLFVLALIIGVSWQRLQPPPIDEGKMTLSDEILRIFSPWHGPIGKAQARNTVTEGEVKGESTDLLPDSFAAPRSLLPVEVYQGSPFTMTLEAMLKQLDVKVYPEDIVEVFPDPAFGIGSRIRVYRSTPIELKDWGKTQTYRTWRPKIGDFLAEQHIELGDNDTIEPTVATAFAGPTTVTITRVEITEIKEKEKIEFKKKSVEDAQLPRGQKKVTPGSVGQKVKTFRLTRKNGVETERKLLKSEVSKEPVDELTIIGTKLVLGESHTGPASWYKYDSTQVASDFYKRGTILQIVNLDNNKMIYVESDGCICSDTKYVVDLHPKYFQALGGQLSKGVMPRVKVTAVKSDVSDLIQ